MTQNKSGPCRALGPRSKNPSAKQLHQYVRQLTDLVIKGDPLWGGGKGIKSMARWWLLIWSWVPPQVSTSQLKTCFTHLDPTSSNTFPPLKMGGLEFWGWDEYDIHQS